MWEGALFEYLKSIGHPFSNMFLDPKETVMKVWQEGGMIGAGDFVVGTRGGCVCCVLVLFLRVFCMQHTLYTIH